MTSIFFNSIVRKNLFNKQEEGFTLVELIVVVVIIGILTSIGFTNWDGIQARISSIGCQMQINSYLKATQAFYAKNSALPSGPTDLKQFTTVPACHWPSPVFCRNNMPTQAGSTRYEKSQWKSRAGFSEWPSTNGHCMLRMGGGYGPRTIILAKPSFKSPYQNWSVSGCFNAQNGVTQIKRYRNFSWYRLMNLSSC